MTPAVVLHRSARRYWALALISVIVGTTLLTFTGPVAFQIGFAVMATAAAAGMAVGDSRTGQLRNVWTGPLAATAAVNVIISALALPQNANPLFAAALGLLINAGSYTAMWFAAWVGLGDVKFVVGLTLAAVALVGNISVLLTPIALFVAAAFRALSAPQPGADSARPHGPALLVAFVLVVSIGRLVHAP